MNLNERIHKLKGGCVHEWDIFRDYKTHRVYVCSKCPKNYKHVPGHNTPPDMYDMHYPDYLTDKAAMFDMMVDLLVAQWPAPGYDEKLQAFYGYSLHGELELENEHIESIVAELWCEWKENIKNE